MTGNHAVIHRATIVMFPSYGHEINVRRFIIRRGIRLRRKTPADCC